MFDAFFEDYIDCKSHTRPITYSFGPKAVMKMTSKIKKTSSKRIAQLQVEIENLKKDSLRLRKTKPEDKINCE